VLPHLPPVAACVAVAVALRAVVAAQKIETLLTFSVERKGCPPTVIAKNVTQALISVNGLPNTPSRRTR
jgi:hypothetical protein